VNQMAHTRRLVGVVDAAPMVLVVDDYLAVADVVCTMLESAGDDVWSAASAEAALQLLPEARWGVSRHRPQHAGPFRIGPAATTRHQPASRAHERPGTSRPALRTSVPERGLAPETLLPITPDRPRGECAEPSVTTSHR
jgi:CheY-like chemotaxis protein